MNRTNLLVLVNFRFKRKRIFKNLTTLFLGFILLNSFVFAQKSKNEMRGLTPQQIVADMGAGWNLGNTLDTRSTDETAWGNPITTKEMIDEIAAKGFKTIRIPVTWQYHTGYSPKFTIEEEWLNHVEEIVNYALDNDMYVILNTHHEDDWIIPTQERSEYVKDRLTKIWTQIANHFIDYGDHLIFETLNEPRHTGTPEEWSGGTAEGRKYVNIYQKTALDAIRNTGGNNETRALMISTYAASTSETVINDFIIPNDDKNVIISLHSYFPFAFCLQGADQTWGTDQDKSDMDSEFNKIYNKFISKNYPVVMGEWCSSNQDNFEDRLRHANYYTKCCAERGICPVWWDVGVNNGSGLMNRNTLEWFFPEIADAIINGVANYHSIDASSSEGGTISPKYIVQVENAGSKTFTFESEIAYSLKNIVVDGVELAATDEYVFENVTQPHTIVANFEACQSREITGKYQIGENDVTQGTEIIAALNDKITLSAEFVGDETLEWLKPDRTTFEGNELIIDALDFNALGKYSAIIISTESCKSGVEFNVKLDDSKTKVIQSEDFKTQSGIQSEACSDENGGQSIGFIENGDWSTYDIEISEDGFYNLAARVATETEGGEIEFSIGSKVLGKLTVDGNASNGWQDWVTTDVQEMEFTKGTHELKLTYKGGSGYLFNMNWFSLSFSRPAGIVGVEKAKNLFTCRPTNDSSAYKITYNLEKSSHVSVNIYSITGKKINMLSQNKKQAQGEYSLTWNLNNSSNQKVGSGIYLIVFSKDNLQQSIKVMVK